MNDKKSKKYYAECTECNYVGKERDTQEEAETDALDHQEDEPTHVVDIIH